MTRPPIQVPPQDAATLTQAQMIALLRNAGGHFLADQDFFYQINTLFEAIAAVDDLAIVRRLAGIGMELATATAGDCEDLAAIYISESDRAVKKSPH